VVPVHYRLLNRATVHDSAMADLVIDVASRLLGPENVETDSRTLGGEDMSVFLARVPGCFFFVGSAPEGEHRPHHSPRFDLDERSLAIGVRVFSRAGSGEETLGAKCDVLGSKLRRRDEFEVHNFELRTLNFAL
jgi:amidohydrolase